MSLKAGRDYLYLIWKAPNTRRNYIVGQLSKNGQYEFSYGYEVEEAIKEGFELLIPFNVINKVYKSDTLFSVFSSRLPDKKRRGIEKVLSKYNLQEYDEYKLLKRGGARLPIDSLEFIDPILDESKGNIERTFYISGVRHQMFCKDEDCNTALDLKIGDKLKLELNPENEHDKFAIKILTGAAFIGHIPRYYSESMANLLKQGAKYDCIVLEVNKENECRECIKVKLEIDTDIEGMKKIS